MPGPERDSPIPADFFHKLLIPVRLLAPDPMMDMNHFHGKTNLFLKIFQNMKHCYGICPSGNPCHNHILCFQHLMVSDIFSYTCDHFFSCNQKYSIFSTILPQLLSYHPWHDNRCIPGPFPVFPVPSPWALFPGHP